VSGPAANDARPQVGAALILAAAVATIAGVQPWLARKVHELKEGDDVFALPPPSVLHVSTLGWDAAAVDLLWADLLVEYGTHWAERRDFTLVPRFVDAILELEPTYAPVYKFVDTLLAYRPLRGTEADVRKARAYLERGMRERPEDAAVWLEYGQFVAFIAPSFLPEDERADWRRDGALAMGRAVELGADAERALAAASVLTRGGQTEAAIAYLQRAYAFTEHPSMATVHEAIGKSLDSLRANQFVEAAHAAEDAIEARHQRELPSLTLDEYRLLGPWADPLQCAGFAASAQPECRRDWRDVSEPAESASSP
jgi:hypothetical protein